MLYPNRIPLCVDEGGEVQVKLNDEPSKCTLSPTGGELGAIEEKDKDKMN